MDARAGIRVEVLDADGLLSGAARRELEHRLCLAVREAGAAGEVRARIVRDPEMSAAHERYSGIPGTTDVLTFDMRDEAPDPEEPSAGVLDVDLWLCIDEAQRQARARGIAVERELLLYALHGVLHCLGHDDHDDGAYERMHAEEDRILAAIGVGATFGLSGTDGAGDGAGGGA